MSSPVAPHIAARSLSFAHGPTTILHGIDLIVGTGDRVGVIGPNGVGKTTLLRLLAGELEPAAGEVTRHPPDLRVGHLHQELTAARDTTVGDHLAGRTGVAAAEATLERTTAGLAAGEPGADDAYADALDAWTEVGVADFESRLARTLERVGLDAGRTDQPLGTLSGGEAARVDLAAVLLHRAPILLLDEPTNDLDLAGLSLLEETLLDGSRGLVVVSHDRALLERTATTVIELDDHTRSGTIYAGGWEGYQRERSVAHGRAAAAHDAYVAERDRLRARLNRQAQWARDGARRAVTHPRDNDKSIRAGAIESAQRKGAERAKITAQLDRLAVAEKPWEAWELRLDLAETGRSGDSVAQLSSAVVDRGGFRLGPVDVAIRFGDRVRIVGPNGSGKSTLIDALLGRAALTEGRRQLGSAVVVGELSQARDDLEAQRMGERERAWSRSPVARAAHRRRRQERGDEPERPIAAGDKSGGMSPGGPSPQATRAGRDRKSNGGQTHPPKLLAGPSMLDAVVDAAGASVEDARASLAKLGLTADDVGRSPDRLSPGERTRAVLSVFQLRGVNLLVLDEPTNHLDLPAIEQLERALAGYGGSLLLVSHDRRFVEAITTTRTWTLAGGRVTET